MCKPETWRTRVYFYDLPLAGGLSFYRIRAGRQTRTLLYARLIYNNNNRKKTGNNPIFIFIVFVFSNPRPGPTDLPGQRAAPTATRGRAPGNW